MTSVQGYLGTGWYVRDLGPGHGRQVWSITSDTAMRTDVQNPTGGAGTYFTARSGETVWESLERQTPWLDGLQAPGPFRKIALLPGHYHHRMARPLATSESGTLFLPDVAQEQHFLLSAQNQLAALIDSLRKICRVVQPSKGTLDIYGHEIRNLLILAATEVEMHWGGIFKKNGKPKTEGTKHYVALADAMRLRDYVVHFHPCPDLDPVTPFAGWQLEAGSTKSLPWYAAYNGVKHNREFEFDKATLGNAFNAVAGCAVMLVAQFGDDAVTPELSSFLSVEAPRWAIEEMYLYPQDRADWESVPHPGLA